MQISRRDVGKAFGGLILAGSGANLFASSTPYGASQARGYGALVNDPNRLLDLPEGFSYRVISRLGNIMDDGLPVPDNADGMGAFDAGGGKIALVRNHELRISARSPSAYADSYDGELLSYDRYSGKDTVLPGGTSTLIYDPATGHVDEQWMSLLGTIRNCAGGITPWGSWLTCEEDMTRAGDKVERDHGYVFEVPADHRGLVDPVPLKAMGRFNHEAAAVDPETGTVYMTEDRDDSLFYRFIPNVKGKLSEGGKLEALATMIRDSRNWKGSEAMPVDHWYSAHWLPLDNVESPDDDLRARGAAMGCTLFARGEGITVGRGIEGPEFFFTATSGGAAGAGQIFHYAPHQEKGMRSMPRTFRLFYESPSDKFYHFGDNLTVAPTGDLIVCEDGYEPLVHNYLRGVTPEGQAYAFARLLTQTETAGACFSPDGKTMFLNIYSPTMTLAITGPWDSVSREVVA